MIAKRKKYSRTMFFGGLVLSALFLCSCALVFPVHSPDISAKEYSKLIETDKKAAKCYHKGFRGVTLALDLLLFWPAAVVDGAGGFYTYYYYNPIRCEEENVPVVKINVTAQKDVDEQESVKSLNKISKRISVAVLETSSDGILEKQEIQFLTNVLQEEAFRALSSEKNVTIMNWENVTEKITPDMLFENCEGSCLVEKGSVVGADYVTQAKVGKFGKNVTITVDLYKTANSKLVASFTAKGIDVDYLDVAIREKAPQMFSEIVNEENNE